jgi:sulfate permease, SulP family
MFCPGELPKLTGTEATGSNPLQELWSWLGTLGVASLMSVISMVAGLLVADEECVIRDDLWS